MNANPALDDYLMSLLDDAPAGPAAIAAPAAVADRDDGDVVALAEAPASMHVDVAAAIGGSGIDVDDGCAESLSVPAIEPAHVASVVALAAVATVPESRPPPPAPAILPAAPKPAARQAFAAPAAPYFQVPTALLQQREESSERRRASERITRWLRMRCDDQHYALELLKVQEVVLPATLLPLRGGPRHMQGVMNLRGQVVPVIDLGMFLGRAPTVITPCARIVVLEEGGEVLGLQVTAVEDVTNLTDQQIEAPESTRISRITNDLFRGVARMGNRTVILLDASQLLK